MEQYKNNSNTNKNKKQPEKPIVTGKKIKKDSLQNIESFIFSDELKTIGSYIVLDVLKPAIKKALHDIVTNGADIMFGDFGSSKTSDKKRYSHERISYGKYWEEDRRPNREESRRKTGYFFEDAIFDRRGDAEDIILKLKSIIADYGVATIADLYDLSDIKPKHTDYNYGWADISSATITRIRDGYVIKMPKALPLD